MRIHVLIFTLDFDQFKKYFLIFIKSVKIILSKLKRCLRTDRFCTRENLP
jgi:hypothetical protein